MNINFQYLESPIGQMIACSTERGVCLLEFKDENKSAYQINLISKQLKANLILEGDKHLTNLKQELTEYFNKTRKNFSVKLDIIGTDFQKEAWNELLQIPYGKTISYSKQASLIGSPRAVRAVANANRMNKIAILIPCHRVIGTNGSLTGYAGGIEKKKWLLDLENKIQSLFDTP